MNAVKQTTVKLAWYHQMLLAIAEFQKKHWFISIFLVRLSAIWFSLVLTYLGESLKLIEIVSGSKKLTVWGWFATAFLTIAILLFEVAKYFESHSSEEPYEIGGFLFLNGLRKGIGSLCDSKLNTLICQIEEVKNQNVIPPVIISNPQKQLQAIAEQIRECLSRLLAEKSDNHVNGKDIVATIAYQFPLEGNEWHWATVEHGLGFDKLLNPSNSPSVSTFQKLLNSGQNYIFYNSKQEAFQAKAYLCDEFDDYDDNNRLKGSIACYKYDITKNDKLYIRTVLSITSYQQQFSSDNSRQTVDNVRGNMSDFVISDFAKRIKIELCLLYLSSLQKNNHQQP